MSGMDWVELGWKKKGCCDRRGKGAERVEDGIEGGIVDSGL